MTETLIISGSLDVSTPPEYVINELLPYLPNSKHIVLNEMSHEDLMKRQRQAYEKLLSSYFDTGTVVNLYKYEEIDFFPARDLNLIAKVGYPLILIMNIIK